MPSLAEARSAVTSVWRSTSWDLASPLPAQEVARRLDDDVAPLVAVGRPERPAVRGWARPSGLRLWVVWPDQRFAAGIRRHLSGVVEEAAGGSVLRGRFALPATFYLGLVVGLLLEGTIIGTSVAGGHHWFGSWHAPGVMAVLVLVVAIALTLLGLWQARHDEEMLRTWVAARVSGGSAGGS